ncbi:class I SAM-dependent methyltransferase [Glaciimonas sp. GG7]
MDNHPLFEQSKPHHAPPSGVTAASLASVLNPAPEIALPSVTAQDLAGLYARLAPLLQVELAALGWLATDAPSPKGHFVQWREHSLRLLDAHGLSQQAPQDRDVLWADWKTYRDGAPANSTQHVLMQLLDVTLRALPEILRGELPAAVVLFPGGAMTLVEGIYRDHPAADYFNAVLAERLLAYVEAQVDPYKLRILEIGAGTGGTSSTLFKQLTPYAAHIEEYCYTDLSPAFLRHAQQHYAPQTPYLQTRRLNIERMPTEQGFMPGHYDIVIAANVLHATRDIGRTLRHAKTLLKADGLLLLNELSNTNLFTHLTFGLLDGWWLAEDSTLRIAGSPALTSDSWQQVLREEGFNHIDFPAEASHGLGQQIVTALNGGEDQSTSS